MPKPYKIVVLLGDGVSREVLAEAVKVLEAAKDAVTGVDLVFNRFECGFSYYQKTGKPWGPRAYESCKESDAILYGAVGLPGVQGLENVVYVHRILRRNLDLFANVRPVKLRGNIVCPLVGKKQGDIDFVIVRENTEDLYAPMGGSLTRAEKTEVALDVKIVTRKGAERIIKYALDLCRKRGRGAPLDGKLRVTCVDKSSVLKSCALFREVYNEVAAGYPDIERDSALIDAWTQWVIRRPEYYDVVVTTNLFGDIISDMTAAIQGGLGVAPSAEIGDKHGLFRPIHGSAPKYQGTAVANPVAAILSAKMLLDWLGDKYDDNAAQKAAYKIENAVNLTLTEGRVLSRDLGGNAKTDEVGDEVARKISRNP